MASRRALRVSKYLTHSQAKPWANEARTHVLTGELVDPSLERKHRRDSEPSARRYLRVSVAFSASAFLLYGIHDYLVIPEIHARAWLLRYAIFLPALAAAVLALRARELARWQQPVMLLYALATTTVVLWIGATAAPGFGFHIYTSYAVIFLPLGPLVGKLNVASQVAFTLAAVALYDVLELVLVHSPAPIVFSFNLSLLSLGAIGGFIAREIERQARQSFLQRRTIAEQVARLAEEQEKSDALLLNVLPQTIAARLKEGEGAAIAEAFPDVTVLFADIVGFTRLSEQLSPEALVDRLDVIFSRFDDLADRLGLEKIKTIGDAYMVVGGLPTPRPDHAKAVAEMAIRMQRVVDEVAHEAGLELSVRIGLHSGPVVAGVIGKRKFAYDVWGDTVNTASRMESHGMPGVIQISDATRQRLGDDYLLECRGDVDVKGKGTMRTWLLLGARSR